MAFWQKIFSTSRSGAAAQPTPAPPSADTFMAPLTAQERTAVSDLSPLFYQVAIEFKKTGKLLGGEVQRGVLVLRGDAKELTGLDQVYPNDNRGGLGTHTSGSIVDPTYASLLELLKKLPVADLERLAKYVESSNEATLLAQSKPAEAAKLYQWAVELNPYDDVSRMSYGCLLGRRI
jgi:hypothetical protein